MRNEALIRICFQEVLDRQIHITLFQRFEHAVKCLGSRNCRIKIRAWRIEYGLAAVIKQSHFLSMSFEIDSHFVWALNGDFAGIEMGDDLPIASHVLPRGSRSKRESFRVADRVGN